MHWKFQSFKYLDKLAQQYGEKKGRGQEAEFQEGFKKIGHACSMEGVLWVPDSTASQYLKVAGPTRKIQSQSKLRQFRKWQAEVLDTQLWLTGMGSCT